MVGNAAARAVTAAHNAQYPSSADNIGMLNANMQAWLYGAKPTPGDPRPYKDGILMQFLTCLDAPNYTVFSNTTSAGAWNKQHPGLAYSLESPHNDVHLAVGGFDTGSGKPGDESGQIAGANGGMGENNTAAMDPIFFFRDCNVDRMFWLWQQRHGHTTELTLLHNYAGTDSSNNGQGPTPSQAPNSPLDLHTELTPFKKADGSDYQSVDCIDIEKQLGFTFGPGSFSTGVQAPESRSVQTSRKRLFPATAIGMLFVVLRPGGVRAWPQLLPGCAAMLALMALAMHAFRLLAWELGWNWGAHGMVCAMAVSMFVYLAADAVCASGWRRLRPAGRWRRR